MGAARRDFGVWTSPVKHWKRLSHEVTDYSSLEILSVSERWPCFWTAQCTRWPLGLFSSKTNDKSKRIFFPWKIAFCDICPQAEQRSLSWVLSGGEKKNIQAYSLVSYIWVSGWSLFPFPGDFKALLQQILGSGSSQPWLLLAFVAAFPLPLILSSWSAFLGTHC